MSGGPRPFPDHFLSIYQSAIADLARQATSLPPAPGANLGAAKGIRDVTRLDAAAAELCSMRMHGRSEDSSKSAAGTAKAAALLALRFLEAKVKGDNVQAEALEAQFGYATFDPAWAATLITYLQYFGPNGSRANIPYRRPADVGSGVIRIRPNAKIAIIGDWGTGESPAKRVANQIKLLRPDVLIHLGDIYYSGTQTECAANFLDVVDAVFDRAKTQLPVYTLSGNHDMYSGGAGYYWLIDQLNAGSAQQRASFFCLRSEDDAWQFLAMDTGLNDYSPLSVLSSLTFLEPDEEAWHLARISEFPGRTILLSHHQPFSACAQIGPENEDGRRCPYNPRLMASFDKFAQAAKDNGGEISAWYWGHEHVLSMYEPYRGVARGRCLGNGGIPTFTSDQPFEIVPRLEPPLPVMSSPRLDSDGDVYALGFGMLTLDAAQREARAEYFQDINGQTKLLVEESLAREPTPPQRPGGESEVEPRAETTFFVPDVDSKSRKIAFVLGNDSYSNISKLKNCVADAESVREELRTLGYDVYGGTNFDLKTLGPRFQDFETTSHGADVVLLFYSGHGVQIGGQNYLIPIDASLASLQRAGPEIRVQSLVNRMAANAKKAMIFLDACRDNPFLDSIEEPGQQAKRVSSPGAAPISDFVSRGLAALEVAPSTEAFIAFAAEPGRYAYEGDGKHSRFTTGLLRHVKTEGLDLEGLMRRIGADVKGATKNKQRPWSQSNLTEDFFFKPASWQPFYTLAVLGLLAGLVTSYFAFDEAARFKKEYLAGVPFACVLGFGIWRWGPRSVWAAALAAIIASLAWAAGIGILDYVGTFDPLHKASGCDDLKFENWKLLRDVIGAGMAGAVFIGGCILGGALTTPSLRRAPVITMALLSGVAVVLVYYLVMKVVLLASSPDCHAVTNWDVAINYAGGGLWQLFLGAALGYGLSGYVPKYVPLEEPTSQAGGKWWRRPKRAP